MRSTQRGNKTMAQKDKEEALAEEAIRAVNAIAVSISKLADSISELADAYAYAGTDEEAPIDLDNPPSL